MSSVAHEEFYAKLAEWVEKEKIRTQNCYYVLNNTLKQFWITVETNNLYMANQLNVTRPEVESSPLFRNATHEIGDARSPSHHMNYSRFRLPSLTSRLLAEIVDITIVFILKVILVFFMAEPDDFHLIPGYRILMALYSMTEIFLDVVRGNGNFSLKRLHDGVMLSSQNDQSNLPDAIGLVLWLIFEIYIVSKPTFDFEPGGCSLGKYLLNLRILSCTHRVNLPDAVDIMPAGNPGLYRAFVRAVLKNAGIWSSLLQIFLTGDPVFSYDLLAGTIVVKLPEIIQPE